MKQFLLLLFCIFQSYTSAQNTVSNETSFDTLVQSYTKFRYKDTPKALEYALQAKGLAVVNGNNEQLTRALYYISKCQSRLNKNKVALKNIEAAISHKAFLKDTMFWYKCFSLKGNILSKLGENSNALIAYAKAKEYAKELGNPLYEIAPLSNIAYIKKTHKDFEEAIDIYKKIVQDLNTLETNRDTEYYRLVALMNIADTYLWLRNPDEAEIYNKLGLKQCTANNKPWAFYPLVMNKAIIHYQKERYNPCVLLAKEVRNYTLESNMKSLYLTSLFYLGKSSYKLKSYQKSIAYLEQALDSMNISDDIDINKKEIHEFLALGYNKIGNSKKTSFHFEQYSALEKKQSAEDLKINNETHRLLDVDPLKTEIDKLGGALTKQTRNKKGLFMLSIGLLILLISSVVYYKARAIRIRKKFEELLKKVAKLEKNEEKQAVPKKEKVTDEKASVILNKITIFEKNEQYLSTKCSLGFMAEKLETNTSYLSKVINTYKGKSFTAYITELRINTALVRLKNNKTLQSYTIKAIAEEFGFKRQETFSKAFKTYTGIYPSQYLKNL